MIRGGLVALLLASPAAGVAETPPALSWEQARLLEGKLKQIEQRGRAGAVAAPARVDVSEAELNSYLNLTLGPKIPQGVSDLNVRLERDRIAARALVDLEQVQARVGPNQALSALAFLAGRVQAELDGRYVEEGEGFGRLDLDRVRLGGVPLAPALVAQFLASSTRSPKSPNGFDILSPFRLPYSLKRIRLQPGRARLEF